jgi:hypothetical protein
MSKWCFNYDSGEYEEIDRDGFSISRGEYVNNWDDSEFRNEEDEGKFNRWRSHHSIFGDEYD